MKKRLRYLLFTVIALASLELSAAAQTSTASSAQTDVVGRLIIRENRTILVNGSQVSGGVAVLTGSVIETAADSTASIDISPLGSLDINSNTRAEVNYDKGSIKVSLIRGCVILHASKNTIAEITSQQTGKTIATNKEGDGALETCLPDSSTNPTVSQATAPKTQATSLPVKQGGFQPGTRCTRLTRGCKKGKLPWCIFYLGCGCN